MTLGVTGSEAEARHQSIKSARGLNHARGKNRVAHAMYDFFIRWNNRRQGAAQLWARRVTVAADKIIRTQPDPAFHFS